MKKVGVFLMVLVLAACASDKSDTKNDKNDKPAEAKLNTEELICPQVAILTEAQDHTDYGGEKADANQLVAAAHMVRVDGDCGYRKNGIDINYTLHIVAHRGPRLGGDQVSFPFYIAVIDPSENILSRQLITARFAFSGKDRQATDDERLHVFIPMPKESVQAGPAYRVLMGFQK